jgi:hypothetical protein
VASGRSTTQDANATTFEIEHPRGTVLGRDEIASDEAQRAIRIDEVSLEPDLSADYLIVLPLSCPQSFAAIPRLCLPAGGHLSEICYPAYNMAWGQRTETRTTTLTVEEAEERDASDGTPDEEPGDDGTPGVDETPAKTASDGQAGFGVVAAGVALLVATLLACRR